MLKRFMLSAAVGALMVSGALAQAQQAGPPKEAGKFISSQGTDHWVFSKFKGSDVIGPQDEHIGSVNDMLFDKSGKVLGVIVGVGGFLGIGEKNVAIDMSAFQPVPASTGSTATSGAASSAAADDPTNVKLKVTWTKDELKAAPDFQYYRPPARTTSTGPGGTSGMAPRPSTLPATPRQ